MRTTSAVPRLFVTTLCCATALFCDTSRGAIDFSPTTAERTLEGSVFKQLIFHEGALAIAYEPPPGWRYSGDRSSIVFTPPDIPSARARIDEVELPAPQPLDATAGAALQTQALTLVPPGAEKIAVVSEEQNPIRIHAQPTYEVVIGYQLYAQEYRLSVLYVNVGTTQLRFRILARKENFDQVHRLFRGSLCSLQWL